MICKNFQKNLFLFPELFGLRPVRTPLPWNWRHKPPTDVFTDISLDLPVISYGCET
jgi:hypothetical protein